MTEKMTQTFTMAFTAKCAECSVCERSTACNLSAFFIFFIKSQLLPAFYTVAVRVSARRRASRGRWVQQGRFEATLSPRPLTKERKCFFSFFFTSSIGAACSRVCVCVCLVRASSLWCECWQQQYGTLEQWGVHWQAADKQGRSTCQ